MGTFTIKTHKRCEFVDITEPVRAAVRATNVREGAVVVYCPHTTF